MNKPTEQQRKCLYPECLQCCCTHGENGSLDCQYKVIETPVVARSLFKGILIAFAISVALVITLMYLWSTFIN